MRAHLFHNPGAGAEEIDKDEIVSLLKSAEIDCRYSSTKTTNWKEFEEDADLIVIAGGDGTVRKVTEAILQRPQFEKQYPLGLLPLGTANNIAKTLGLRDVEIPVIMNAWHNRKIRKFDIGYVSNNELEQKFFLESLGFGIFPYLMMEMKKLKDEVPEEPSRQIIMALRVLLNIISNYEPRSCDLIVDGKDYSGTYLLAEVMNTRSIGPNLCLAPNGDPGDGVLDVVLVPESDKEIFQNYVSDLIKGKDVQYAFRTHPAREIDVSWNGTHVHVDDQITKIAKNSKIQIKVREGLLQFLVV